ncbi:putative LRR receptor-like serine/threonine-protein kinase-like isoform 1 [Capsicum annuum]|nr:putative LRR receptor-like serine/threonine-protein kinase-like isoform 1 [Capsicum annuum]KAF3633779.1 putative LRR receptor-like serine/threonine-protein kinase-like isoform 1 [Capsicum annuum]
MNEALCCFMILAVILNTMSLVPEKTKLVLRDEAESELLSWLSGSVVTLTIKYLNFCIAKMLQFRYLAPLQTAPSTIMSLVFWVALTRSVSALYS